MCRRRNKRCVQLENTQPLLKHDHKQKGSKFSFLGYQLQFIKIYQFIKIIETDITKMFID